MKETQTTQNHSVNSTWTFMAIRKDCIAKRTEEYLLIKLPYGWSAILTTKFLKKKEHDDVVFMSIPSDYNIKLRQTQFDEGSKTYLVVEEKVVDALTLLNELRVLDKFVKGGYDIKQVLSYDFNAL